MDDTPRRVSNNDMIGRAPSDDVSARSTESTRGYGATGDYPPATTSADAGTEADTTQIRREIEQTREEMSETIDAIQEKLKPGNIVSSATDKIKNATTERVRQMTHSAGNAASSMMYGNRNRSGGFMDGIRENPLPAALIGIGAAWLLMRNRSDDSDYDRGRPSSYGYRGSMSDRDWRARNYTSGSDREDLSNYGSEYGTDYSRTGYPRSRSAYGSDMQEHSSGILDRVKNNPVPAALAGIGLGWLAFADSNDRDDDDDDYGYRYERYRVSSGEAEGESMMAEASEKVSDAASGVADTASEMTSRAQDYARDASWRARRTGRRAQNELQRMTQENPLAVGAGALLLGAIVGLAIPETERENEMLGETRDQMIDKAQQMARDATSRAQDAAADLVSDAASRIVSGKTE